MLLQTFAPRVTALVSATGTTGELIREHAPEALEIEAQIKALVAAAATIPAPNAAADISAQIIDLLAEGKCPAGAELAALAGSDAGAIERYGRANTVLRDVVERLRVAQVNALHRSVTPLTAALNKTAIASMAALRSHPVVKAHAHDLPSAFAAGVGDQWSHYEAMLTAYAEPTTIMLSLVNAGLIDGTTHGYYTEPVIRHMPHPEKVWPSYLAWRRFGASHITANGSRIGRPPWPDPKSDEQGFVRWLIDSNADVWVPTPEQLDARIREVAQTAAALDQRPAVTEDRTPARFHLID